MAKKEIEGRRVKRPSAKTCGSAHAPTSSRLVQGVLLAGVYLLLVGLVLRSQGRSLWQDVFWHSFSSSSIRHSSTSGAVPRETPRQAAGWCQALGGQPRTGPRKLPGSSGIRPGGGEAWCGRRARSVAGGRDGARPIMGRPFSDLNVVIGSGTTVLCAPWRRRLPTVIIVVHAFAGFGGERVVWDRTSRR